MNRGIPFLALLMVLWIAGLNGQNQNLAKPSVLFIHGLAGNHHSWDELMLDLPSDEFVRVGNIRMESDAQGRIKARFQYSNELLGSNTGKIGYPCFTIEFSDNQNLTFEEQGYEVKLAIDKITDITGRQKVILFGHSMGGLAARSYLNQFGINSVAGLVTAATPHLGSYLGEINNMIANNGTNKDDFLLLLSVSGVQLDAKAVDYLSPCSPEMSEMNSHNLPTDLPVSIVLSNWDNPNIKHTTLNFITGLTQLYAAHKDCQTGLRICTPDRLEKLGDGIVPYISQDIRFALPNTHFENLSVFTTNEFHNDVPHDTRVMGQALMSIVKKNTDHCLGSGHKKVIGFILDSSGSMKGNDPNDRRLSTVSSIIDQLNGDEYVFIMDFDDVAKWVNNDNFYQWDREKLKKQVMAIDADGGTNIGVSLSGMQEILMNEVGSYFSGGVILFTDGKGAYNGEDYWFQQQSIPVFTVSFTGESDARLLSKIASSTGGQYMMASTEADVINALDYFFNSLNCYSVFFSETRMINQGEEHHFEFNIDQGTHHLLGAINTLAGQLGIRLYDPNGVNSNKEFTIVNEGTTYATFELTDPVPGKWIAEVVPRHDQTPNNPITYNLRFSGDAPGYFSLGATVDTLLGIIDFSLLNSNDLLKGARISTTMMVIDPKGDSATFVPAGTGSSFRYRPMSGEGNYNFHITMTIETQRGQFNRHYYNSVLVGDYISSHIGEISFVQGSILTTSLGRQKGTVPGLRCYVYDANGRLTARGLVGNVKDNECTIQIKEYFSNSPVLSGNKVELDYKEWVRD